jgi:glycolate oxidase
VREIQLITRYCFEKNIAITPRGAGSGLSGGSIPAYGGVGIVVGEDEPNFRN